VESYADPRIVYLFFSRKGSVGAVRNAGSKISRGKILAFLDSDDQWSSNKLLTVGSAHETADIVYHNLKKFDENGRLIGYMKSKPIPRRSAPFYFLTHGNGVLLSSASMSKRCFDQLNGFSENPELFAVEDYDLWTRAKMAGMTFQHIDSNLGFYRVSANQISAPHPQMAERFAAVLRQYETGLKKNDKTLVLKMLEYQRGSILYFTGDFSAAIPRFASSVTIFNPIRSLKACIRIMQSLSVVIFEKLLSRRKKNHGQ
jgi:glycosyltransferase involved in cell wall biosynthesis